MSLLEQFRYYDIGWNARIDNKPFNPKAYQDWKDGWKDYNELSEVDRVTIGYRE